MGVGPSEMSKSHDRFLRLLISSVTPTQDYRLEDLQLTDAEPVADRRRRLTPNNEGQWAVAC